MGVNHNIIHLYRQQGFSQQQAYDKVSELLNYRYRQWYIAHSEVPSWGEELDVQIQLYLKGCQDVILGNLNWRLVVNSIPKCQVLLEIDKDLAMHFIACDVLLIVFFRLHVIILDNLLTLCSTVAASDLDDTLERTTIRFAKPG